MTRVVVSAAAFKEIHDQLQTPMEADGSVLLTGVYLAPMLEPSGSTTVVERIRFLGYEPSKHLTWAVGNRMTTWYREEHGGRAPLKALRRKTNDLPADRHRPGRYGSHCFAIYYADNDIAKLDAIIHIAVAEPPEQLEEAPRQPVPGVTLSDWYD